MTETTKTTKTTDLPDEELDDLEGFSEGCRSGRVHDENNEYDELPDRPPPGWCDY